MITNRPISRLLATLGVTVVVPLFAPACGGAPTESCNAFVECADYYATVFELGDPDTGDYELSGACWFTPRSAQDCDAHCVQARADYAAALRLAGEDEGACSN